MSTIKPQVGTPLAPMTFNKVGGGSVAVGGPRERWTLLIVYRGKHCPLCKRYLGKLNDMLADWNALLDLVVVSADTEAKASEDQAEFKWDFDLCYGLTEAQMRDLGLYVSDPMSDAETDARFAEPGIFAMRPDGELMMTDISNSPAARPDLDVLLGGLRFNIENGRPTRGLA